MHVAQARAADQHVRVPAPQKNGPGVERTLICQPTRSSCRSRVNRLERDLNDPVSGPVREPALHGAGPLALDQFVSIGVTVVNGTLARPALDTRLPATRRTRSGQAVGDHVILPAERVSIS